MALKDVQFSQDVSLQVQLQNQIRNQSVPALSALGAVGAILIDLPEFIAAIAVVAIAMAIIWAADLFFVKGKEILGGVWVVGSSLVRGLAALDNWVKGLFNWLEQAVYIGVQNIAQFTYNTGQAIYNTFSGTDRSHIAALQTQVAGLQSALAAESTRAFNAEQSVRNDLNQSILALTGLVNTNRAFEQTDVKALQGNIDKAVTTEQVDIAKARVDLVTEANTRAGADAVLQQEIDQISGLFSTEIAGIRGELGIDEATIAANASAAAAAIRSASGEISTLQTTVTGEEKTIAGLESTVTTIEAEPRTIVQEITSPLEWTAAQIATLTELADDPCLCLAPLGGIAALGTLIAGLEVGVL